MIYVDDCNLLAFIPTPDATGAALQALQQNVLLWQGGLKATGGALLLKNALGAYSCFTAKATTGCCMLPNFMFWTRTVSPPPFADFAHKTGWRLLELLKHFQEIPHWPF